MSAPSLSLLDEPAVATAPVGEGDSSVIFKALQILDAFQGAQAPLGVSELARRAGLPKSTTFRMLRQLLDSRYVARIGTKYRLSTRLFELGNQIIECGPAGLRDTALPHLGELHHRTGESVHLAVLEGADVLYLDKIQGARAARMPVAAGSRMPATTTAVGKALLAFSPPEVVRAVVDAGLVRRTRYSIMTPGRLAQQLAQIRQTGLAYDNEESVLGVSCVGAAVRSGGRAVAAVSVSGASERFDRAAVGRLVERAAHQIAACLPGPSCAAG